MNGPKTCGGCGSSVNGGCGSGIGCACGDSAPERWMYRGDTYVIDVSAPGDPCLPPWNLSGAWAFWFTAKESYGLPDNYPGVIRLGSEAPLSGVAVVDAASGAVRVTIPPAATERLADTPVCLVWDIQSRDPAGAIRTIAQGTLTVYPDVTRSVG